MSLTFSLKMFADTVNTSLPMADCSCRSNWERSVIASVSDIIILLCVLHKLRLIFYHAKGRRLS